MTVEETKTAFRAREHGRARWIWTLSILLYCCILLLGSVCGLRLNITPSEPLGIWRIRARPAHLTNGDLVFICPPDTPAMRQGLTRGYLRSGLCAGGFAPLIKTVIAQEGQRFAVDAALEIDGRQIAGSHVLARDSHGRGLGKASSGLVPDGQVMVFSNYRGSWDSRYFGPIPKSGILGLAQAVLTVGTAQSAVPH